MLRGKKLNMIRKNLDKHLLHKPLVEKVRCSNPQRCMHHGSLHLLHDLSQCLLVLSQHILLPIY